jgi:hypothetical protein
MSGFDLFQNPDGADFQAQAVLAYLRDRLGSGIEQSWDPTYHRYTAEPKVTRYDNGREQGYIVYMRGRDYSDQINIAFYEHRNSDNICAVKSNQRTFNAPLLDDILKVMTDKYDTTKTVGVGQAYELAGWIADQLIEFWDETELNAADRTRKREEETRKWEESAANARKKAYEEDTKRKEGAHRRARSTARSAPRSWWEVLGVTRNCTQAEARTAWRKLAMKNHPDSGGDTETMQEINAAWTEAQRGFKKAA